MAFKIVPREISHKFSGAELVGKRVCRGPDWIWDDQDDDGKSAGTITCFRDSLNNVRVQWDFDGSSEAYRFGGKTDKFDLDIIDESSSSEAHVIMPREEAYKLSREDLVGRRVIRGRDWSRHEDEYDNNGKAVGTIMKVNKTRRVVYVKWDGLKGEAPGSDDGDGVRQHYFMALGVGSYEVDILISEGAPPDAPRVIMNREEAYRLSAEEIVGRRVVRGQNWNVRKDPAEDRYDDHGKNAGTVARADGNTCILVKWDGVDGDKQHYWDASSYHEVDILLSGVEITHAAEIKVRPYDPTSPWERPNILVMALFASEFEDVKGERNECR